MEGDGARQVDVVPLVVRHAGTGFVGHYPVVGAPLGDGAADQLGSVLDDAPAQLAAHRGGRGHRQARDLSGAGRAELLAHRLTGTGGEDLFRIGSAALHVGIALYGAGAVVQLQDGRVIVVAARAVDGEVIPVEAGTGAMTPGAQQGGPVRCGYPAGGAAVRANGDDIVTADEIAGGRAIEVFHQQVIDLPGLQRLRAAEPCIGEDGFSLADKCRARTVPGRTKRCCVEIGQMPAAAIVGQDAQANRTARS